MPDINTLLTETQTLRKETCCNCHVLFAMPQEMHNNRRKDRQPFYCPNGHAQHFTGPTPESELRTELDHEKRWHGYEMERRKEVEKELEHQKYKTMAERSAKVRLKKRIANGACPCCQRQFQNLRQHITDMHPGFAVEANDQPAAPVKRRGRPAGSKNKRK